MLLSDFNYVKFKLIIKLNDIETHEKLIYSIHIN